MSIEKIVTIPDLGGAAGIEVIEWLVKVGDKIAIDTPLMTLESDKASMDIPSDTAGTIVNLLVQVGDRVSMGDAIVTVRTDDVAAAEVDTSTAPVTSEAVSLESAPVTAPSTVTAAVLTPPVTVTETTQKPVLEDESSCFAGPGVRRFARSLGVRLSDVQGTGRKDRIMREDVERYVKTKLSQPRAGTSGGLLPPMPAIDFSQFGSIEIKPLNKIKRLTGQFVHRSWVNIPHVTQFDTADITELEEFRKQNLDRVRTEGGKLTILAFVCKAVSLALAQFPAFNSSLDPTGEHLIYKHYCHIGIAVETPQGLVVPVIKNVNQLSVIEIAQEMGRLSTKAREKGLSPADMSGGCFTISSLGGIGGHAFTPIVNAPEVAILGLSRSSIQPVYQQGEFVPRLLLPLSLSYDHRVIDGAEGARFTRYLSDLLSDIRHMVL